MNLSAKISQFLRKRTDKEIFVLLIIFYLIVRFPVFYTSSYLWHPEEPRIGGMGKELYEGMFFNLYEYQYISYQNGTLIDAILAAIYFSIFGVSWVSLKLVGFTFSVLMLIVTFLFVRKFFNRTAAILSSLFLTLSPANYMIQTFISMGGYLESLPINLLALYFFYNIFFGRRKPDRIQFIVFGVLCGLAFWFNFSNLAIVLYLLLWWFLLDRKSMIKSPFILFFIGFLVGISPVISHLQYYAQLNKNPYEFVLFVASSQGFPVGHPELNILEWTGGRLVFLLTQGMVDFLFISEKIPWQRLLSWGYYLIFLAALLFIIRSNKTNILALKNSLKKRQNYANYKEIVLIGFIIFYAVFHSYMRYGLFPTATDQTYDPSAIGWPHIHRFKLLFFPFIVMTMSIFFSKLIISKKRTIKYASFVLSSFLILTGTLSVIGLLSFDKFNPDSRKFSNRYMTYNYETFYQRSNWEELSNQTAKTLEINFEQCAHLNKVDDRRCYDSLAWAFIWRFGFDPIKMLQNCHNLSVTEERMCMEKLALGMGFGYSYDLDSMKDVKVGCNRLLSEYRRVCYVALGWVLAKKHGDINNALKDCEKVKPYNEFCTEGITFNQKSKNISCTGFCDDELYALSSVPFDIDFYNASKFCDKVSQIYRTLCTDSFSRILPTYNLSKTAAET